MAAHDDSALDLDQWSQRLTQALQLLDLRVDADLILDLADRVGRDVGPEAAPLTAFYVGYAAGTAAQKKENAPDEAVRSAVDTARRLSEDGAHGGRDDGGRDDVGWAATGQ